MPSQSRRTFLRHASAFGTALTGVRAVLEAQVPGERPGRDGTVQVINPRGRVPVGLIIDDSSCLVNLNRFAVPQFAQAWGPGSSYTHNWHDWPYEIPDAFVRRFGTWCAEHGVRGKYSVVPYPACVGRLDRMLPGWTDTELKESIALVRSLMVPNWDIHPEMVTHTRIIDLKTGHPYQDHSLRFMENWEWTTGRSPEEIAEYIAYALRILKNVDLPCEGITTPGGFGNKALPQLAQGTLMAVREIYQAEIPHYFRHLYDRGTESVAPRVEYAAGLDGTDPRCVVSIIGCTGDWTGGWDCTTPGGADKFISEDLSRGRMVDVIQRGEPAMMVAHWTGIYFNGYEIGFRIFQEVVRRLHARFDHLVWMKLSEVSRYWAAKELTRIDREGSVVTFRAPFACADYTIQLPLTEVTQVEKSVDSNPAALPRVSELRHLRSGTWHHEGRSLTVCFDLPKGNSTIRIS